MLLVELAGTRARSSDESCLQNTNYSSGLTHKHANLFILRSHCTVVYKRSETRRQGMLRSKEDFKKNAILHFLNKNNYN